jgi:hypothetical protein
MSLRLVDTAPGVNNSPITPGKVIRYGLKTSDSGHAVELGTLQTTLGFSSVMNSGFVPDQDANLANLGAVVQFQTTELRNPVAGEVAVTQSAPGILFTKSDNSANDKCVYAVTFPVGQDAGVLGYFKFKVHPGWATFSPDWLNLTSMTGMYFGLEHGSYNTACYFFLRNAVAGGSAVIGGPLQAFNTSRPGQAELSAFQWSTLADGTDVEVWIYFNPVGYPPPFSDPYVPVVEIWTRRAGVDAQPVSQTIIPTGSLGTFQPLSDTSFSNVRAGFSNQVTLYFGNTGQTGDLLQLDDWALFPDYRMCVQSGAAMPSCDLNATPDCLVSYQASDNVFPDSESPVLWFPIGDFGFLRPSVGFFFQADNIVTPYALTIQKATTAGYGFYKSEPRLENGVEGAMIESFLYGTETTHAVDSFGAGISIEDGTHAFQALLIQSPTVTTIGILKTTSDQSIAGYYTAVDSNSNPIAIDWTTPHLVRLALDKLRQKVTLYVDEELVLEVPSTGTFPNSTINTGRMSFGFLYPGVDATGSLNVVSVNYSPRYKAYEVRDMVSPDNASWMPWTQELVGMGTGAFNYTALSGTATFTHGSPGVVGVGTSFLTQVTVGQYVKNLADPDSDYLKVLAVVSNTQLTLTANYGGPSASGATAVVTNPDSFVISKQTFGQVGSQLFYTRDDDFGEDKGFYIDFEAQVLLYTDSLGRGFAPSMWMGAGLNVYLGNKVLQLVFVDAGTNGRFVGVVPGSGSINDLINQTKLGQAFSSQVDWTQDTLYRVVLRGFDSIEIWDTTTLQAPLITIPWRNDTQGFDLPLNTTTPSIQFGHFDDTTSSQVAWSYVRYGIGDGYSVSTDAQLPQGLQPYLFGGKVFTRITFDES